MPTPIRKLIGRCLERDPKRRLRDIGEARLAIEEVLAGHSETSTNVVSAVQGRSGVTFGLAGAVIGLAIGAVAAGLIARAYFTPTPRPETRLDIATPPTSDPFSFALSPEGRQVAFVALDQNALRVWIRRLDADQARALPGTDGASFPFWSPDGTSIGFFAGGKLKRLEVDGTRPTVVADASTPRGGSWGSQGEILYAPSAVGPIFRVAVSGGPPIAVTRVVAGDAHRAPQWLPDGRRFLYFMGTGTPERRGIYLATLDRPEGTRLVAADSAGQYRPPDQLLYVKDGTLVAHTVNLDDGTLSGEPVAVASDIAVDGAITSRGTFDVSQSGLVAYRSGQTRRRLVWLNSAGGATEPLPIPFDVSVGGPAVSRDGRRLLLRQHQQGNDDIWIIDLTRNASTRVTFNPATEGFPVWSPDGQQFAFRSNRAGAFGIFTKPANGEAEERQLLATDEDLAPTSWSPDGRWLLYYTLSKNRDLWVLPMTGANAGTPVPFLRTEFDEALGQFSPDGRWIAYQTDESGVSDIAVRPFPGPGGVWRVSTGGAIQPRWSPDGKALYYLTVDGRLMSVPVTIRGTSVEFGASRALEGSRLPMTGSMYLYRYDVGPDGRLLTVGVPEGDAGPSAITLVLDWKGPK